MRLQQRQAAPGWCRPESAATSFVLLGGVPTSVAELPFNYGHAAVVAWLGWVGGRRRVRREPCTCAHRITAAGH